MSAVAAPRARWSSSSRRLERPPGVDDRSRRTSPVRQRQAGAVDRDPGREPPNSSLVDDDHLGRALAWCPSSRDGVQPALGVPQPRFDPVDLGRCRSMDAGEGDARAPAGRGPPRRAAPRASPAAVASWRSRRTRAAASSTRSAARSTSPPASAWRIASAGSPFCSYQALARRCSSGDQVRPLVEQPRPQHVGEEVVVAVPAGAGRRAGRGRGCRGPAPRASPSRRSGR